MFALRPAFASKSAGQLSDAAQIRGIIAGGAALALCALIVAVALRFPAAPAGREPLGPLAGTTLAGNELLILLESALLLHERSGLPKIRISASDLGFERLAPPLWTMESGELLLNASKDNEPLRLQRCNLNELSCYTFSAQTQESPVTAIASSLLGEHIFLLGARGELWHSNSAGEITTQASVQTPWGHPRLLASGGLLLVPAGDGPMLGVYRPDHENFGQQLDALLVMPAQALTQGQDRLRDVALGELNNWALMAGDTAAPGLFKLDKQWGNAQAITLPKAFSGAFFIPWRDKLLIADPSQGAMQRLSNDGTLETPFTSALLTQERDNWLRLSRQRSLMRQLGMGLPLLLAMFCAAASLLYFASYRSQTSLPQRRSALLDPMPGGVAWLPASSQRASAVQRTGLGLLLCCFGAMAVFGGLGGWRSGLACLPVLAACAYAW
ncbi:MAG: hypothetical protein NWQ45_01680, partial [Congregibacter sp.]|nr:hypothetical protein [Congregibacter sp.]